MIISSFASFPKYAFALTSPLASFTPITLTQTGDIAHDNVEYQNATAVISALPTTVTVTLVDTTEVSAPITWTDTDTYNAASAASYTFTATWGTIPEGANNDNSLAPPTLELTVTTGSISVIAVPAIAGVTAPVTDATPVTEVTETDEYTGTVIWSPNDNPFLASTPYTATITLAPKTGYTLTGITADFFTVEGTSVHATNSADSGIITAVFPATEAGGGGETLYFNAAVDNDWNTLENWWTNAGFTSQALNLPTESDDVVVSATVISNSGSEPTVNTLTVNGGATIQIPITVLNEAIFNDSSINLSFIIGEVTFNNTSENQVTITGNATFNDSSFNSGDTITGNATFNGDLSEEQSAITGTKTRRYTADTYPGPITRDFTVGRPWTVLADGVAVDITGAIYDNTTTFTTLNGGSFVRPDIIEINSCAEFMDINNNLGGSYLLTQDLNCINQGSNIIVGASGPFTGTFDGGGHTITIAINARSSNNVGLFGTANGATISDLNIAGVVHGGENGGYNYIGALVGYGVNLDIDNVTSSADVSGDNYVGGLIGELDTDVGNATVDDSSSSGNVSGTTYYTGGLIGYTYTSYGDINITNSHSSGTVDGNYFVGGLIGETDNYYHGSITTIRDSYSTSSVIGTITVGGLVGYVDSEGDSVVDDTTAINILNSYHTIGEVSGSNYTGGLVGFLFVNLTASFTLSDSYATGTVSDTSGGSTGGLIGYADFAASDGVTVNITGNHFSGDVSSASYNIGGLIGYLNSNSYAYTIPTNVTISDNYTTGTVSGSSEIGGLIGYGSVTNNGSQSLNLTMNNNYSTSTITGTSSDIGGLIGGFDLTNNVDQPFNFTFNQNYASSVVTGVYSVGGLFGYLYSIDYSSNYDQITATLSKNYFIGTVLDTGGGHDGGLFGYIQKDYGLPIIVSDSYVDADITGPYWVGGITGQAASNISFIRSYVTGTVTGNAVDSYSGGGLIGDISNNSNVSITDSFSTSEVSDFVTGMGALVGNLNGNTITFTNSFYDQTSSGQTYCTGDGDVVAGCTAVNADGLTPLYFKNNHTNAPFENWDFSTIWRTNANGYPTLRVSSSDDLPIKRNSSSGSSVQPLVNLNPVLPTTNEGCAPGNLFNTITGKSCEVITIQGCDNRTTGFSIMTGQSCVGNSVITTTTYNLGTTTLKNGSKGEPVKELQRYLNTKLNLGLVIDGKFGPKTRAVVVLFQKANGLVADGLVGKLTKAKMNMVI